MSLPESAQSNASLRELTVLISSMFKYAELIEQKNEELSRLKAEFDRLNEHDIPNKMDEIGIKTFELTTGEKVGYKDFVNVSIPAAKKQDTFNWLNDHGFGDIIKTDVTMKFGKEESERAKELVHELRERGIGAEAKQAVHPMTLKAFANEQMESGTILPEDLFSVYVGRKTVVK